MSAVRQFLEVEASMRGVAARLLLAAGQEYSTRWFDHGYGAGAARACYRNAFQLALENPEELVYCEGRAASHGIVIEHAWCATRDGRVIDTTWTGRDSDYFGIAFRLPWLLGWIERSRTYGVIAEHVARELLSADPAEFLAAPLPGQVAQARRVLSETQESIQASRDG